MHALSQALQYIKLKRHSTVSSIKLRSTVLRLGFGSLEEMILLSVVAHTVYLRVKNFTKRPNYSVHPKHGSNVYSQSCGPSQQKLGAIQ